jgi:hypothetical protein
LQRSFWTPLRKTMEIFHVLPLVAAVIIFVLFATDGQLREIYISYLEGSGDGLASWIVSIVSAVLAIGLISVALYQAHNALSTMRLNVVFSSRARPEAESKLPRLQRAAAFTLAFTPWLGLTVGLFNARNFITARYCQLLSVAHVDAQTLRAMHQFLPNVGNISIASAIAILGGATAFFVSADDRNRSAQWAVAAFAPVLAVLLFLLFTDWLNMETQSVWILVATGIAATIYSYSYDRLYHKHGVSLLSRPFVRTGISVRKRRQRRLILWGFLPWLALAIYFWLFKIFNPVAQTLDGCTDPLDAPIAMPAAGRWAIFPLAMCCTIAVGLLVCQFLLRFGSNKRLQAGIPLIVTVLAFSAVVLSAYNDAGFLVAVYRFIGPLATVSFELLFVIAVFVALGVLSQQSGFPALTLIVLTIVVCVMFPAYAQWTALALGLVYFSFAIVALVSGRQKAAIVLLLLIFVGWLDFHEFNEGSTVEQNPAPQGADAKSVLSVRSAYLCWLDRKGVPAQRLEEQRSCGPRPERIPAATKPYAVFIIAAEGGGIYAASATAAFLAKLGDVNSEFASHIFAISGVSGGAIGATVFQALDRARHSDLDSSTGTLAGYPRRGEEECTFEASGKAEQYLYDQVVHVMQDDHFSPIVGAIFPEIFSAPLRRPEALRATFEYSVSTVDQAAGRELCDRFRRHWTVDSTDPALILNSTWVETGFRVAFAPFRLHDLDESLYSFADTSMPNEDCHNQHDRQSCVSLMSAAGVSARFPGIMSPFSVKLGDQKRWNFVDGGYSDNSGTTTALEVYRALQNAVGSSDVDLRLVFITSSRLRPNLLDSSINGTVFHDTLAPIEAIMKVREDLANDAVARACSEIYGDKKSPGGHERERNEDCTVHAGTKDGKLQIIEIQDQTYGLPLGWKISKTSLAVVSWMLGDAKSCNKGTNEGGVSEGTTVQNSDTQNSQLTEVILRRNTNVSCVLLNLARQSLAHTEK